MQYTAEAMETGAVLTVAQLMCAAARTAPKTRGIDNIETLVLTGEDLQTLADRMEEVDRRQNGENRTFISRDAGNVRKAQAVVLIGVKPYRYGLDCRNCGFETCAACGDAGGLCMFSATDLGIAVGSAASTAAAMKTDTRVMYSVGKGAEAMHGLPEKVIWLGLPLSVSGKNPFFDRKKENGR